MAKPKFYLEPRQSEKQAINMFFSFNRQRLQYYTGIRIDKKHFRPECNTSHVIKPIKDTAPFAAQYNTRLKEMAAKAVTIVTEAKGENLTVRYVRAQLDSIYKPKIEVEPEPVFTHDFTSYFEDMIKDMRTGKRIIQIGPNKGSRFNNGTIKNYLSTLNIIKKYLAIQGLSRLPFEWVNKEFYDSFRTFCFDVEEKEISTFSSYIKVIKTIMSEASPETFRIKDFIKPGYEADSVSLSLEQIDMLAALDLSNHSATLDYKKNDEVIKMPYQDLDYVRDLFLVGCYTGLRFGNYGNLDVSSVDGKFIKLKQVKTGSRVSIPILSKLRPVIEKYKEGFPSVSNQKFNELIKIVADMAGLNAPTKIRNNRGGKEGVEILPLNTLISSHTARRSYATNMFKLGIPPMLIMSATGHKKMETFLIYVKATNEDKAILMGEALDKLGL